MSAADGNADANTRDANKDDSPCDSLYDSKEPESPCVSVCALDENDIVVHAQLVPEIAEEPDYDAALAALDG